MRLECLSCGHQWEYISTGKQGRPPRLCKKCVATGDHPVIARSTRAKVVRQTTRDLGELVEVLELCELRLAVAEAKAAIKLGYDRDTILMILDSVPSRAEKEAGTR